MSARRLAGRAEILHLYGALPAATVATDNEVLAFIESEQLFGRGIGYIDAHLLAATTLSDEARLWTSDAKLRAVAEDLGLAP